MAEPFCAETHTHVRFRTINSKRSLIVYALTDILFVNCFTASQLQWNPTSTFKASKHLFNNLSCHHPSADDRFGFSAVERVLTKGTARYPWKMPRGHQR